MDTQAHYSSETNALLLVRHASLAGLSKCHCAYAINLGVDHRCLMLHFHVSFRQVSRSVSKRIIVTKGWAQGTADKLVPATNEARREIQEQDHRLEK